MHFSPLNDLFQHRMSQRISIYLFLMLFFLGEVEMKCERPRERRWWQTFQIHHHNRTAHINVVVFALAPKYHHRLLEQSQLFANCVPVQCCAASGTDNVWCHNRAFGHGWDASKKYKIYFFCVIFFGYLKTIDFNARKNILWNLFFVRVCVSCVLWEPTEANVLDGLLANFFWTSIGNDIQSDGDYDDDDGGKYQQQHNIHIKNSLTNHWPLDLWHFLSNFRLDHTASGNREKPTTTGMRMRSVRRVLAMSCCRNKCEVMSLRWDDDDTT